MSRLRMVLVPRGRSAAQVALVLVALQNGAHLLVQHAVKPAQAQGDVFVDRTLRYAERLRRRADGGVRLRYVFAEAHRALFGIAFHTHSSHWSFLMGMPRAARI